MHLWKNLYVLFIEGPNSIQITSSEYVILPDYDDSIMYNDIAIINLPSKIEVNFEFLEVKLPTALF